VPELRVARRPARAVPTKHLPPAAITLTYDVLRACRFVAIPPLSLLLPLPMFLLYTSALDALLLFPRF
jgi:hypothetical protein